MGLELAAILGIAGAAIATTTSIVGGVMQHEQAKANADAQAAQAAYNAKVEANAAAQAEAEAAEEARRQHEAAEKAKAAQRALLGKSGAAISSGSPLAILGESAITLQQQINDTHRTGYMRSQVHKEQQKNFLFQEKVAKASKPSGASLLVSSIGHVGSGLASAGNTLLSYNAVKDKVNTK